ncbi:MAG: flagellar basal-body rod protein FlgF [Bacillota bacterium]|jgi:flagellar hook protein FlgE
MLRSLYAGVTGMKNHQTKLDVIANNISNVNTAGFKASTVTFQDLMSQTIRNAVEADSDKGGVNPAQVGTGSTIGSIETSFVQGPLQYTGRALDLAIQGNGFFVVEDNEGKRYFTREGSFRFDSEGYLVNTNGFRVLGTNEKQVRITEAINTVSVDKFGVLTAIDNQGDVIDQVELGIAFVTNPESLLKEGSNLYSVSTATGDGTIDQAGQDGRGTVEAFNLEMSNVDLSNEFANLITTQRGYQANARVITVSDQILEELVNLKR